VVEATGRYARLMLRPVFPDEDFAEYGLDDPAIVSLRAWATGWCDDLARRLASDHMDDETPDDS
jgi:hypothetical protein